MLLRSKRIRSDIFSSRNRRRDCLLLKILRANPNMTATSFKTLLPRHSKMLSRCLVKAMRSSRQAASVSRSG
jgi:hypothetical protein